MSLKQIQRDFIESLKDEQKAPPFLCRIKNKGSLSNLQRFSIYQDSILEGIINALTAAFPVCVKLLGIGFFRSMAIHYIQQSPPTSPNLDDYGQDFAAYVQQYPQAKHLEYLYDVCRLEWAYHRAYFVQSTKAMTMEALQCLTPTQQEDLVFLLPNQAHLLSSQYPVCRIWHANQDQGDSTQIIDLN